MISAGTTRRVLVGGLLISAPLPAHAQQLYECKWTLTTITVITHFKDGSTSVRITQDKVEVCRPISIE